MEYREEFDVLKTKVLKYILYKKRTEAEIKQKFANMDQEILLEIIDYLKESGYISDSEYIEKAINEFIKLKNMSIKEVKYKLKSKGLDKNLVEDYINKHWDEMYRYEQNSAKNIILKKQKIMDLQEIRNFLMTKGYITDIIEQELMNS